MQFSCTCEGTEQLQGYTRGIGYLPQIAGIGFAEGITSEKRFVKQETGRKGTTGQKGDSMKVLPVYTICSWITLIIRHGVRI